MGEEGGGGREREKRPEAVKTTGDRVGRVVCAQHASRACRADRPVPAYYLLKSAARAWHHHHIWRLQRWRRLRCPRTRRPRERGVDESAAAPDAWEGTPSCAAR